MQNFTQRSVLQWHLVLWIISVTLFLGGASQTVIAKDSDDSKKVNSTQGSLQLVDWTSEESQKRFARSRHKQDFFRLSNHFQSQDNKISCGLASSSIVLNALFLSSRKNLPIDETSLLPEERKYLPASFNPFFEKFTPMNVVNDSTKKRTVIFGEPISEVNGESKTDFGIQLRQLAKILSSNGAKVKMRVVSRELRSSQIKKELVENLSNGEDYILVNYSRKVVGQEGGGHISPLGAYDQVSDSFLVMDTNINKAPWVWVGAKDLIAAMRTFDTKENRGYLLVSK